MTNKVEVKCINKTDRSNRVALRIKQIAVGAVFVAALSSQTTALADPAIIEQWQGDVSWSTRNTGVPDCPGVYMASNMNHCLIAGAGATLGHDPPRWVGNRSCVMVSAIANAHAGNCIGAFGLTLMTQCHNGDAQTRIQIAGPDRVCSYLKEFSVVPQL